MIAGGAGEGGTSRCVQRRGPLGTLPVLHARAPDCDNRHGTHAPRQAPPPPPREASGRSAIPSATVTPPATGLHVTRTASKRPTDTTRMGVTFQILRCAMAGTVSRGRDRRAQPARPHRHPGRDPESRDLVLPGPKIGTPDQVRATRDRVPSRSETPTSRVSRAATTPRVGVTFA